MHFSVCLFVFFFWGGGGGVARKQTGMKISLSGQWQQHAFLNKRAMIYINFSFVWHAWCIYTGQMCTNSSAVWSAAEKSYIQET